MSDAGITLKRLHQVALPCSDPVRAKRFYQETLGAELIAEFDPPGLVFSRLGPTRLLLERTPDAAGKLLADGFLEFGSSGRQLDRTRVLAALAAEGGLPHRSFASATSTSRSSGSRASSPTTGSRRSTTRSPSLVALCAARCGCSGQGAGRRSSTRAPRPPRRRPQPGQTLVDRKPALDAPQQRRDPSRAIARPQDLRVAISLYIWAIAFISSVNGIA